LRSIEYGIYLSEGRKSTYSQVSLWSKINTIVIRNNPQSKCAVQLHDLPKFVVFVVRIDTES